MIYYGVGTLQYSTNMRVVAWVDRNIANFYRSLIPKYYNVQPQKYLPHITVVRPKFEKVKDMKFWKCYEGETIEFSYSNKINFDGTYFYLDAQSNRIGDIREELGLPRFRVNDLGTSRKCYHITIGNVKNTRE